MKKVLLLLLVLVVAVTLYLFTLSWSERQRSERLERGFEVIKIGDSRDAVVAAMGGPNTVADCPPTPFSDPKMEAEFRSKCFQQFSYVVLMKVYTISFDQSGAVINKTSVVSP